MSTNPRVWSNFTVNSEKGEINLRLQDMPSDRIDDVADLFVKYFATQETFHKVSGVSKNKEALEECREFVKEMLSDKNSRVVICCVDDDANTGDPIAGSIMVLEKKGEPEDFDIKTKTEETGKMFKLMESVFGKYDVLKDLNLDIIYDDRGVVVHPEYRGFGIAQKLFNSRRLICEAEGIPMTGAWMTSYGSQKAAERDGWETVFEISYEDISKESGVTFEGAPRTCKFMVTKANID